MFFLRYSVRFFSCLFLFALTGGFFLPLFSASANESQEFQFQKRERELLKEGLLQTDREFVRLLKKRLAHRLYLSDREGKIKSPYLSPQLLTDRSFPQKLEDADASYLQIYYAPKELSAAKTIMYEETRMSLQEYRGLLDDAAPMEILEVPEYIRVTQPPNRSTYSAIWKMVRSYGLGQVKAYLELAEEAHGELPSFRQSFEENQDSIRDLTDAIKTKQKEILLRDADREVVIQYIEYRLIQILQKKIEEYRGRRSQLGKSTLKNELKSDLLALQRALEANGFLRDDYRKITRPLTTLFEEEIAKQRKRIRKRVREIVAEQKRVGMPQREAVFHSIRETMVTQFARELSDYEGKGQLNSELGARISNLQNVMEDEFRRQLRNAEQLSYKERKTLIKEEVVGQIEQRLRRYLDIQTWRQEGAKAARAEKEKQKKKEAPIGQKIKALNPFAKKTAQQETIERFIEKLDEVRRMAGTDQDRAAEIEIFRGQLYSLFKETSLADVRDFRDLDVKEVQALIEARYINKTLLGDLERLNNPLVEAGEDHEIIKAKLVDDLTEQLVNGIIAARNLKSQSDGDLTKEFKILLLSKMISLEKLEGYSVDFSVILKEKYKNNPDDLRLLKRELEGYVDFSRFDSYQINFEALRRFAYEGDLALQLGSYFRKRTDEKKEILGSVGVGGQKQDEYTQKRREADAEFNSRKATTWLLRENILAQLKGEDLRFLSGLRDRIPEVDRDRIINNEYYFAEEAFKEAVKSKDPVRLEVESLALFRQALDDQPKSSFQYHARFRIGDVNVEQAYLLLEQSRDFLRQGKKQLAQQRELAAQRNLAEARNIYANEALFNPPPDGFPRTEFARFWLAQLNYDQGNIAKTRAELDLFLEEFSNNRGDLKLGDNVLFMMSMCQADQGDYSTARATLDTLFTRKSTGRLMGDMARARRARLTTPEISVAGTLTNSEYGIEFASIKRDLHPHYLESYKVIADIQLEDGQYPEAIQKYQEAIDSYEKSLQRRTYGDAENHYVTLSRTQQYYNESLVGLASAFFLQHKHGDTSTITDLDQCIKTIHKLLQQLELSPSVLRKAHLILGDVHYVRADYYSGNRSQKDQAVADYEEVIRTYHIVETEYPKLDIGRSSNLAQTYLALNMPYEAISILDKQKKQILVDQASHPGLHQYELDLTNRMLGAVHRRLKNYTEAIASYRLVQNKEFKAEVQSSIKNLQKLEALGN